MRSKHFFRNWLNTNPKLSENTKRRYANAIDYLSQKYKIDLYKTTNIEDINNILSDPEFKSFNNKQNRMFGASLRHFKKYIDICNKNEREIEIRTNIIKENLYYTNSQKDIISEELSRINILDKPQERPLSRTVNGRRIWKRNALYAAKAIIVANYLCEFDSEHRHFISKTTNKNYVEAHHLIPMSIQDKFDYSLDIPANIISICVICHKQLHHGVFEDKKMILEPLFLSRKKRLEDCGIKISLDELFNFYRN